MPIPFLRCGFATSSSWRRSRPSLLPVGANASTLLDRNARGVTLKVDSKGQAVVSYTARGKKWNVLAWGAVNAIAPAAGSRQVDFKLDYSGGWGTYKKDVWKTVREHVRHLQGPTARMAGDGVHGEGRLQLGVQSWQRMLPNYGVTPNPNQAVWELRLSHWTGAAPRAHGERELGLRQVRPPLRDVPLQGRPRPRVQVDGRRQPARHLRPQPLRRHVQLGLRRRAGSARTASSCTRARAPSVTASTPTAATRSARASATAPRSSAPA